MSDVTKLPKWAQQHIQTLEQNVRYYERQAYEACSTDPLATDTHVDTMLDRNDMRGLPKGSTIRFTLGKQRVSVRVAGHQLDVRSDGAPIFVKPWACNHVTISTEHPVRVTSSERDCALRGNRIIAIKSIRERTGWGLRDAKQLLDAEVPVAVLP
jgi:hypothetical protein